MPRRAFTLIELLVVVTIIVVLLALLTPALDRAIYETEVAVCASQLKTISTGTTLYAASSARSYPYRYWRTAGDGRSYALNYPGWGDDRPVFEGYFPLATLVDPFVDTIRLDAGSGSGTDSWVYTTRSVWAGWGYRGQKGMLKLGDHMTHIDPDNTGKTNRFDLLASDLDMMSRDLKEVHAAHPDIEAKLAIWTSHPTEPRALPHVFSEWFTGDRGPRGELDAMNYASADGSVFRLNHIQPTHGTNAPGDERLRGVDINHTANTTYLLFIPPAN